MYLVVTHGRSEIVDLDIALIVLAGGSRRSLVWGNARRGDGIDRTELR
jgi:hypothetical protein